MNFPSLFHLQVFLSRFCSNIHGKTLLIPNHNPTYNGHYFVDIVVLTIGKKTHGYRFGAQHGHISGISCQLGDYMLPIPPFRGNRNNH